MTATLNLWVFPAHRLLRRHVGALPVAALEKEDREQLLTELKVKRVA
jgi:hypothetical protein